MKYFIYLLAIIILLGVNLGLFNNLQFGGQIPNFLLLLTVYFSLEKKDFDFFFIAFVCGVFLDFYSANFFGGYTLAFLATALALHIFVNYILVLEVNWKSLTGLIFCSLVLVNFLLWLYGLLAFKLNLAADYTGFKIYLDGFLAGFI